VIIQAGKPHEREYAKRIVPLVEKHHLLLVSLRRRKREIRIKEMEEEKCM
jgi:hypothetical protein